MNNFLDWRDYSRQPHIKQLIETKGLEFARQQFIKDSNKLLWDDPFVIQENHQPAGQSLGNNNSAAVGSSPQIIGDTAEVSRFTWASGITNKVTGSFGRNNLPGQVSASIHGHYFDVTAYNGTVDYSADHTNSTKTFRFLIVSSSKFTYTNTTGLAGLITASYTRRTETVNITGSLLNKFKMAVANQSATAVVAGFTNTIAPSTLFNTPTLTAGSGSITILHKNKGGVPDIATNITSGTGSVSVVTQGLDKYYNSTNWYDGAVKFDGSRSPYTSLIRKG